MADEEATQPVGEPVPTPTSDTTRRRVLVAVALVAVLVIGIVAAVALTGSDDSDSPSAGDNGANVSNEGGRTATSTRARGDDPSGEPGGGANGNGGPGASGGGQGSGGAANGGSGGKTPATQPGPVPTTKAPVPPTIPPNLNPIEQAFMQAWFAQCVDIWKIAGPDGYLWDADNPSVEPYTVGECQAWASPQDAMLYEEVPDAAAAGAADAKRWMAARLVGGKLRNADGSKTWSL
jgi:hypothetical protein